MIDRYKITIWNAFCFISICICLVLISPYLLHPKKNQKKQAAIIPPITEKDSVRKVWKRGKRESFTAIKEDSSISDLNEEISHSSDGWVSITWRKKNDS